MIELPFDAKVICTDGRGGTSVAVTMKPATLHVSHIIVEDDDGQQRLVPLSTISKTSHDEISLDSTEAALKEMPLFLVNEFVERAPQQSGDWEDDEEGEWEDGIDVSAFERDTEMMGMPVVVERVPEGEVAFHRGTDIEATDDHVGTVEILVLDADNGRVTHLVLERGHLWGKKRLMVPVSAVESIDYDAVYLNIDKDAVEALPELPK